MNVGDNMNDSDRSVLKKWRRGTLVPALLFSTAFASAAFAQAATTSATASPGASADAAETTSLEEVVVTARKRSEDLQKTPVSETVISGATAEQMNVRNFQDLRGLIPNLEVTPQSGGAANLTIRGIGQISDQVNADTKTGFYVNDMYVSRQEGNALYFYDVDSLQVLNGPQGTLFGKNTTGGALLLTTARPDSQPGGYLQVRMGSYSRVDTEGAFNLPINDQLMSRFSFRTENADGFIKHVADSGTSDNVDDKSVRAQIRWLPTAKLSVDFLAEYNVSNTDGMTNIVTGCNDNEYYTANFNALHTKSYCSLYPVLHGGNLVYGGANLSIPTDSVNTDVATGGDYVPNGVTQHGHFGPFSDTQVTTTNLRLNYQLTDDVSLKSITAVRHSRVAYYNPTQNAPDDIYAAYNQTSTTQVTEEDNVTGAAVGGRLNYVGGLYYYSQRTSFTEDTGPDWADPTGYLYVPSNHYASYAAYAQTSYKVIPPVELTFGLRYTVDRKSAESEVYEQTNFNAPCATLVAAFEAGMAACNSQISGAATKQWSKLNPRGQLSYQVTDDVYLYGSVGTGYNAGGFNQQLSSSLGGGLLAYGPEKLIDYEGGIKSEWLGRALRLNLTAFRQKFDDIQTTVIAYYNGIPIRAIQTGASAQEQGIEAEIVYSPIRGLLLRANGSLLDQKYTSIAPGVTSFTLTTPVDSAPKHTYALSGSYTFHLAQGQMVTPSINYRAVGARPACDPAGSCYLPAYGLLGARLDFKPSEDSSWTASLWGTNLTNALVELGTTVSPAIGISYYNPGRPREYGVELQKNF
jgi:iron complex outermembrane receptor protein